MSSALKSEHLHRMDAFFANLLFLIISFLSKLFYASGSNFEISGLELATKLFGACNSHIMMFARPIKNPIFANPVQLFIHNHTLSTTKHNLVKYEKCRANIIFPVNQFTPDFQRNLHRAFGRNGASVSEMSKGIVRNANSKGDREPWYEGRYENVFFILVGHFEPRSSEWIMSALTRNEYPNHWFAINTRTSPPTMKYICLRCLPTLWANSTFRFDLWNWNGENITPTTFDLFDHVINWENRIVTLYWLDYWHMSVMKTQYDKRLSYGPRHVLSDIRSGAAPIVPSDVYAPLLLGGNLTFSEYQHRYIFSRQTQLGNLQDIQIQGVCYIVQHDDVGGELGPEEMYQRNYQLAFTAGHEFRFMTCSSLSTSSRISFLFYSYPFHGDTWGVIVTFLVILPTLVLALTVLMKEGNKRGQRLLFLYSTFSMSLIEMHLAQPKSYKTNKVFLLIFLVWSASSVIISNA